MVELSLHLHPYPVFVSSEHSGVSAHEPSLIAFMRYIPKSRSVVQALSFAVRSDKETADYFSSILLTPLQPAHSLGPLAARQRNAIGMAFR